MMEEKNELNDIILNRGGAANNNKKIILAVATLGVILIIVVMLMDNVASNNTDNLPQAVLPPKPEIHSAQQSAEEPLFEDVKVIKDEGQDTNKLDDIARKLKEESQNAQEKTPIVSEVLPKQEEVKESKVTKEVVKESKTTKEIVKESDTPVPLKEKYPAQKDVVSGAYYIQVGSFSKYEPNKKFLTSITDRGYTYTYQNMTKNATPFHKVLVGPFKSEKEARDALKIIRESVEPGAFLTKM